MSQEPKTQQVPGKPAGPPSNAKAGASKPPGPGGSKASLYLILVLLIVGAVVAGTFLRKSSEEPRPVVSAAEEEGSVVASETEGESSSESASPALVITSDVRGADVYLNGNRVGKTPHKATPLTPGDYDVKVALDGYETFEAQVHVETPDESIHADLVARKGESTARESGKAPAVESERPSAPPTDIRGFGESVAVKHNHRIGSCEGMLRATREGVGYETDHKDAFFTAYADVEELSLDGDKLTLKVREGRKYDFNGQGDDNQALVEFHARVAAEVGAPR